MKVRYQCNAGEALWMSVKQSADGRYDSRLEAWGSSEIAATWLQTHREGFTCDGKSRTTTFTVDALQPGSKGSLERGVAYVQFCLSQGDEDLVIYETGWVDVR